MVILEGWFPWWIAWVGVGIIHHDASFKAKEVFFLINASIFVQPFSYSKSGKFKKKTDSLILVETIPKSYRWLQPCFGAIGATKLESTIGNAPWTLHSEAIGIPRLSCCWCQPLWHTSLVIMGIFTHVKANQVFCWGARFLRWMPKMNNKKDWKFSKWRLSLAKASMTIAFQIEGP